MTIRIILVDNHALMRQGMRLMLEGHSDISIVAEASEASAGVDLAIKHKAEVAVVDADTPDCGGGEFTRQLLSASPQLRVVGLTGCVAEGKIIQMMQNGASSVLTTSCCEKELIEAVRCAVAGQAYVSGRVARMIAMSLSKHNTEAEKDGCERLSVREQEILKLVAGGASSKEIAGKLHITVRTVEFHRHKIMSKLAITSIAALTKYAIRMGLSSLDS